MTLLITLNDPLDVLQVNDDVLVEQDSAPPGSKLAGEPTGLTEEELEQYRDDPTWKTIRFVSSLISAVNGLGANVYSV